MPILKEQLQHALLRRDVATLSEIIEMWGVAENEVKRLEAEVATLRAVNELMHDALHQLRQWAEAYPLDIFPEPDLIRIAGLLRENGMTLDSVSAHIMRHALKGIRSIVDEGLKAKA